MSLTPHTIECPIDPKLVQGMCEFKNTIYIAYPQGFFFPLDYHSESSGAPYGPPNRDFFRQFQSDSDKKKIGEPYWYEIHNMFSIKKPELMILHYYVHDVSATVNAFTPSYVVVVNPDSTIEDMDDDSAILCDKCSHVAVSFHEERRDESAADPDDSEGHEREVICPLLVTANGKKFTVYQSRDKEGSVTAADFFKPLSNATEVDTNSVIDAIGVTKNAVCFYGNSKYRTYWFETKTFSEVASLYVERPFVIPITTQDYFLIGNPNNMIVSGKVGEKPSNSISYNKGYENIIPTGRPRDLMLYRGQIYQYFDQAMLVGAISRNMPANQTTPFKIVNIPKIKFGCQRYELTDLLFITEDEMLTVGEVRYGSRLASKAIDCGIDVAITCVQRITNIKDQMDVVVDMFKDLWVRDADSALGKFKQASPADADLDIQTNPNEKVRDKYKDCKLYAIKLVSNVLWRADVREILSLFPTIMLSIKLEKRELLDGTLPIEEPSSQLLEELGKFLYFTSEEYKISNDPALTSQMPVVDTALFEIYAMFTKTRELDAFMREQNSIDLQLVGKFFSENKVKMKLYPAIAIYQTRTDKQLDALHIWRALDSALTKSNMTSNRWALEASYTLREISDQKTITSNLEWIKARDVSCAVNAFLYPKVLLDYDFASEWITKNCPTYINKFYDYLTTQPDLIKYQGVVKTIMVKFTELLMKIKPNWDIHELTYSERALEIPKGTILSEDELNSYATELANKIARIIRTVSHDPDFKKEDYAAEFKQCSEILLKDPQKKYKWLLFEFYQVSEDYSSAMKVIIDDKPDFNELEEFCRNSPHPDIAFTYAFQTMREKSIDIMANNASFLVRNIEWVDFVEMLDWLPKDQSIRNVENILTAASIFLIQKERFLTFKNNIAISMKKEADYKNVQAKLRNVQIQHQTLCQACHRPVGSGWVAIAPDSRVYHIACKPKLPPRK